MSDEIVVSGLVGAPFEGVRDAFSQNFTDGLEIGANFSVFIDGECVVNLFGGYSDRGRETPWSEETLVGVYSSGKAVLATLVAQAVSEGSVNYDAPVAEYWPEFGAAGKESITVVEAMSHQAGLCGFADEMPASEWLDWEAICHRIEKMSPLWSPRSASGYSPQIVGFVIGEILRRTIGDTVHNLLAKFQADGAQIFCGMQPDEMVRAAYMRKPPRAPELGELTELKRIAFLKPWSAPARVRHEDWMAAEIPSSNMHANAQGLAWIVHPFANRGNWTDGNLMIDTGVIEEALTERIRGDDLVLPFHLSWSAGLMRNINAHFGPSDSAFGHAGFGGSCVMVDPENRLSAAYVMNKMSPHLVGDPRAVRLFDAVYDAL